MTVEYGNSEVTLSLRNLIHARSMGLLCSPLLYYIQSFGLILITGLSAMAAFLANEKPPFLFLGLFLTGYTFNQVWRWRPYKTWLNNHFFHWRLNRTQRKARLEISGDGIREYFGEIVSFAPWKDVLDTLLEDDLLVIKLTNTHEVTIPRTSPGISELNLDEIRGEVDRRRIAVKEGV